MKTKLATFVLSTFLLALSSASADTLPQRKAGLWSIKMEGGPTAGQTMQQCIDEATDKKLMEQATGLTNSMCQKNEIKNKGASVVIDSECTIAGSKIVSTSEMSGDFNSKYTVVTNATYNPPIMGMTQNTSKVTATYMGACKAGQKPGEIEMENGMKIDPSQAAESAKKLMDKNGNIDMKNLDLEKIQKMVEGMQK